MKTSVTYFTWQGVSYVRYNSWDSRGRYSTYTERYNGG